MKKLKKALSLLLALVMMLGMVNLSAFAVTTGDKTGTVANGAFMADQENKSLNGTFDSMASNTVSTTGGKVQVTKSAEAVPCEDGNQFDVTLQVVTQGEEIKTVTSPDAAVTLVMDVSISMDFCSVCKGSQGKDIVHGHRYQDNGTGKCGYTNKYEAGPCGLSKEQHVYNCPNNAPTRLEAAQAAAKSFIENFAKDAHGASRMVSLVTFAETGNIRTVNGKYWVNVANAAEKQALFQVIDGLKMSSGTNINAGLKLAKNLYTGSSLSQPVQGISNRFSILLTDGAATRKAGTSISGTGNNVTGYTGVKGDNSHAKDAAEKLRNENIESYGIYFGTDNNGSWMSEHGCFDKNVTAQNADELNKKFEEIVNIIKLAVDAWTVNDPMAKDVMFVEILTNQNPTVANCENGVLTWDLKTDRTAKMTGENQVTYTLKYRVSVDATGANWDEEAVHPLNRYTELKYMFLQNDQRVDENGNPVSSTELDTIGFNVPGVIVEKPERPWRIEYYKQIGVDSQGWPVYPETPDETTYSTENVKVGTVVKLIDQDQNYRNKYATENYKYVSAENTTLTIHENKDFNVIRVYYNRMTTSAVVNYHYELTIIDEQGHEATINYKVDGTPVTGLFVGDAYSVDAPKTSIYGGYTYNFDRANPDGAKITGLDAEDDKNVIDLYYKKTIDYRKGASVVVNHVYTLHTYELENGKYVAKDVVTNVDNVETETGLMSGDTYTANTTPRFGYNSYQYTGIAGRDNVKVLGEGENVITLNFEDWEDPRGSELSLTVNHHYTKTVTEVVDGEVVTTTVNNEVSDTPITFYAGETVNIAENPTHGNETYNSDAGNAQKAGNKDTTAADGGTTIDLYYTLTKVPEKTSVTVTHIYQTVTRETVTTYVEQPVFDENGSPVMEDVLDEDGNPVIDHYDTVEKVDEDGNPVVDEDGNPIVEEVPVYAQRQKTEKVESGTEVKETTVTDDTVVDDPVEVYAGQSYTAALKDKGVYTYTASTPNGYTIASCAEDGNTIEIIYQKDENADNRGEATINVQHIYTTHVTAIVGGEVKTINIVSTQPGDQYTGKAGDAYKAEPVYVYGGNTYTLVGSAPGEVILHEGANRAIEIYYERDNNQLGEEVNYTVNYEYYTRSMTVVDGVAVWGEPVLDETTAKDPTGGNGYVGQKVELDTGAKDGYTAYGDNPSAAQFLAAEDNSWTFKYVKDVPLEKVSVTVNHHVTTITKTVDNPDGDRFTQDIPGRPEYKYVGEFYEAKALELDENAKLTLVNVNGNDSEVKTVISFDGLTGTTVVDFYYEVVNDYRVPASYTVQHIYKSIDWDGKVTIDNPDSQPIETKAYAGQTGSATVSVPEGTDYKLTEVTYNGSGVKDRLNEEGVYNFTVLEGANTVVLVYERKVDTRPLTAVKVVHEYYTSASAEAPAYTDEEITKDLRVSAEFKAAAKPIKDNVNYAQITEDGKLTINALGEVEWNEANTEVTNYGGNVITIKYVLANTTYKVVHEYYTDGNLTGSTDPVSVDGKVGDVITAGSITQVPNYGGNDYTFDASKSDASITLVQGENGTIILRYYRTSGGGDSITPNPTYKVTYEWSGLPAGADAKVPGDRNYSYNSSVKVNTTYTGTSEITVDGVVYTFSGWTTEDVTVNNGGFRMPSKTVTLVGVWTAEDTDIPDENPPLVDLPDENPPLTDIPDENPPLTDIPDEQPPLTDMPDEQPPLTDVPDEQPPLTDVPDEQPPLADVPDEQPPMIDWPPLVVADEPLPLAEQPETDIPEEDSPLADVPQTGDFSAVWYVAVIGSVAGLAVLTLKKREDEET